MSAEASAPAVEGARARRLTEWVFRVRELGIVVVLGSLAVLTVIVFWSGAPGIFGACAAWLAGLTKGGRPLGGAARVAGIVGVFVAVLNILLSVGGILISGVV